MSLPSPFPSSTLPDLGRAWRWLCALLLGSAALKAVYVFGFTPYADWVYSDSAHYYHRALAFLAGEAPTRADWDVYPLGATVLLALYWKALALIGISGHTLETALALNVVASTACVAIVWRLALLLGLSLRTALLTSAAYAVFFPLVYLNAFTLSEGPAQLFFLLSLLAVAEAYRRPARAGAALMLSGLAWVLACHCRGSFLLAALPFALLILWQPPAPLPRWRAGLAWLMPASLVFAAASATLWWASDGLTSRATGANGGVNFFMQQCHFYGTQSTQADYTWIFYPPVFNAQPQLGIHYTAVPFLNQGYFLKEGLKCLHQQPDAWTRLLAFGPSLFYGVMYPTRVHAPGFAELMPWSRHTLLILTLLLPAGAAALWRRAPGLVALLLAQSLLLMLTFVGFNADHRHLYSLAFVLFLFGAAGIVALAQAPLIRRLRYTLVALTVLAAGTALFGREGRWSIHRPHALTIAAEKLAAPLPDGSLWTSLHAYRFWAPLTIDLGGLRRARALTLSLNSNDVYELGFHNGETRLGRIELTLIGGTETDVMQTRRVAIPERIAAAGFDRLTLTAKGDGRYAVAALALHDAPLAKPATDGPR